MKSCETYEKIIDLRDDYFIDDYDLLCNYFKKCRHRHVLFPQFFKIFNESKCNDEIHLTIPFTNEYRKKSMDIVIVLDKHIISNDKTIEMLHKKICLLEKRLENKKYSYVV